VVLEALGVDRAGTQSQPNQSPRSVTPRTVSDLGIMANGLTEINAGAVDLY
jgi:hypothetical protein